MTNEKDDTKIEPQSEEIKETSEPDKIKESSEIKGENIVQEISNTDDIQISVSKPNEPESIPPGMRLRQLREQKNVSIKHVADRLFLDTRVIEKLEADDYEHLPPLIFIRGYMRNYAKLLDIPPESILDDFDPNQLSPAPNLRPPMKRKEQASRHDLLPTIGTISVIIILLVLTALWKYSPEPPTPPIGLPEPPITEESVFPPESSMVSIPESGKPANDFNEPNSESSNNLEPTAEIISTVNDKTVKIHFKARSWMEITDKTNATLYEGISIKGKILSLDGTPPFYLKIGNVDGVNVEYKGETNDIRKFPKRRGQKNLFIIGSES